MPKWASLLVRVLVILLGLCVLFAFMGCNILTAPVDYLINTFAGETRLHYTAKDATQGGKIANARLEFFALRTGGDPAVTSDYETVADALLTTGTDGTALLFVKSTPNEARDTVVRPAALYRLVVNAAGFEQLTTSMTPYEADTGVHPKTVELQRAGGG